MSNDNLPKPPGHKSFIFESICISSDFDSGNCCNAEKIGNNQFNIWIATDHPKNNYRTWFHFSIQGATKGLTYSFAIKNMQNQSRLLNQGLVPVYREQGNKQWSRVSQKINTSAIEYYDGYIQWTFKHNFKNNSKHFFAFFYPWSNQQNSQFLSNIQQQLKKIPDVYCYRTSIIKSLENRDIQFLVISSKKNKLNREQQIDDDNLFKNNRKPYAFSQQKQGIVLSARVHPGEVPGSHVMTGIIKTLSQPQGVGKILRDQFVFYIFPILNPDGVSRGHYRVDTNGINLNRCYLSPSAKQQPSIYAIKKIIMHLHTQNRFFAYLDLHAHASRKGTFIYGNCSNQLMKQVKACIFPKLLSMNSIDFEYEGSNFTQKNMYSKDRGDHISKQGSGRVAIFKATKNAYCWTLQCNYNSSRIYNVLEPKKHAQKQKAQTNEKDLDGKIISEYRQPQQVEAKQFFTIQTYRKLGRQICETFLDMIEKNPQSRIDNPANYFKTVANVKMNLAVALLRMAPNRFQPTYKKIFMGIANYETNQSYKNSLKSLYYLIIKNARIPNIQNYLKTGDQIEIQFPSSKSKLDLDNNAKKRTTKNINFRTRERRYQSIRSYNQINLSSQSQINSQSLKMMNILELTNDSKQQIDFISEQEQLKMCSLAQIVQANSIVKQNNSSDQQTAQNSDQANNNITTTTKVVSLNRYEQIKRVTIKLEDYRMIGINSKKKEFREAAKTAYKSKTPTLVQEGLVFSKIITQAQAQAQAQAQEPILRFKNNYDQERFKIVGKGSVFMQ